LAGAIEGYAGAGFGLGGDGGVANDLCKDEGGSVGREISVLNLGDGRWVGGALLRDRRDVMTRAGGLCLVHVHHAVMRAVPSATGREIRCGAGGESQQRRDQRCAEEEK